jgi:hypothetical protein
VLEDKANQHSHVIAILQDKIIQLSTEVSALQSAAADTGIQTLSEEISAQKTQIAQKLNDLVVEELSTYLIELRTEVLTQKMQNCSDVIHCHSIPTLSLFGSPHSRVLLRSETNSVEFMIGNSVRNSTGALNIPSTICLLGNSLFFTSACADEKDSSELPSSL